MASPDLTSTITSLEHATWRALQNSGADMLPFLSSDCVMLFPLGLQVSAQSEPNIKDILTSDAFVPWEKYEMSKVTVTPVGADGAAITYTAHATKPGTGEFRAVIASVWRREGATEGKGKDDGEGNGEGEWKLCVHQQTPFVEDVDDVRAGGA